MAHRANFKGAPGKTCSKCSMSHPPREYPVWGKKCHKCGNKNHFSTCCRLKQKGPQDSKRPPCGRNTTRCPKSRGRWSKLRSRSRSNTQSTNSIELNSFQDHPQLPGRSLLRMSMRDYPMVSMRDNSFQDPEESTNFVKKIFHTIYRSKSVSSSEQSDGSRWQNQDPHDSQH